MSNPDQNNAAEKRGLAEVATAVAAYPAVKEIVKDAAQAIGKGKGKKK